MKTLRMTLMISLTFATMMTLAATKQEFKLKYLSDVSSGKVLLTIPVQASDKNEAMVSANRQCVSGLMDLNVGREDIIDICNNPRL